MNWQPLDLAKMDSEKLREIVLEPEESAKLDFKIQLYKINEPKPSEQAEIQKWSQTKEEQWAELTKDILALSNGNINTATKTGYIIIGADDKLKLDGTPNLRDVGDTVPTRKEILDKVNSYCQPPLPDIQCQKIPLDSIELFVISIPPSPYLHKLSKELKTPKKQYSPHTVLVRRGDGEKIYAASSDEQIAIEKEKKMVQLANYENNKEVVIQERDQKLSPEVYDRKIEIYRTTRSFLALILSKGTVTVEEILRFSSDTDEALFLFDQKVEEYLQKLYQNGVKLHYTSGRLADSYLFVGEERSRLAQENSELLAWFTEQPKVVRNLFYTYISL